MAEHHSIHLVQTRTERDLCELVESLADELERQRTDRETFRKLFSRRRM